MGFPVSCASAGWEFVGLELTPGGLELSHFSPVQQLLGLDVKMLRFILNIECGVQVNK